MKSGAHRCEVRMQLPNERSPAGGACGDPGWDAAARVAARAAFHARRHGVEGNRPRFSARLLVKNAAVGCG